MREIKFRAWSEEYQDMRVVDSLLRSGEVLCGDDAFKPDALMQYTGLKDKNGKEIYEGDLIRWHKLFVYGTEEGMEKKTVVEWSEHRGQYRTNGEELTSVLKGLTDSGSKGDVEVIGNIYEDPELVTV